MAPVFADHPFPLIATPTYLGRQKSDDFKPDMFERVASEMACVHNMIIRGMNSIYLQAPHVAPSESKSFVRYSLQWYRLLHIHHSSEETDVFVKVEEMAGEKGIMDGNVAQHEAFSEGVTAFKAYLDRCASGEESFDGLKVVTMIDAFGNILVEHLTDEIPTLLDLRRFGTEKMAGLEKMFGEEGERNMKELGLLQGMPWGLTNHDLTYEDGTWAQWPPAPWIVLFLCKNIIYWLHRDMWKFGSCDRLGRLQPLYAVAEEKTGA